VKKEIDCQIFEDQLDELLNGSLSDEGIGQLQHHALSCPDCAMLFRVKEHLTLPPLEELEAAVPEDLLASVWSGVQAGLKARPESAPGAGSREAPPNRPPDAPAGTPKASGFPWLVPTLAAASVVLLFSTGFLFSELRQTDTRRVELAEQVGELEKGLAGLNERTAAVERTADLAGRNRWIRALSMSLGRQESVSIEEVRRMVNRLPPDRPLFTATEVEAFLGGLGSWGFPDFGVEVSDKAGPDGLSAQELLAVFDSLDLPPDLTIPASRLRNFIS